MNALWFVAFAACDLCKSANCSCVIIDVGRTSLRLCQRCASDAAELVTRHGVVGELADPEDP